MQQAIALRVFKHTIFMLDSPATQSVTKFKLIHVIKCASSVEGIAQLGPELFVCSDSDRVSVYDLKEPYRKFIICPFLASKLLAAS